MMSFASVRRRVYSSAALAALTLAAGLMSVSCMISDNVSRHGDIICWLCRAASSSKPAKAVLYAATNSASSKYRCRVRVDIPAAEAAAALFLLVSSAAMALCCCNDRLMLLHCPFWRLLSLFVRFSLFSPFPCFS